MPVQSSPEEIPLTVRFRGLKERLLQRVYFSSISSNHLLPEKGELAMRKTLASLASLVVLFIILAFGPNWIVGQDLTLVEKITIDPVAEIKTDLAKIPQSFCVTDDEIFVIPDHNSGTLKILGRSGDFLKFIEEFGRDRFGPKKQKKFSLPMYCLYNQNEGKLGIIDYGVKRIFLFERIGMIGLKLVNDFECQRLGYDIKLAGDNERFYDTQIVISGYLTDTENNPFDLYSRNVRTGKINYLLPSHEKYNLETNEDFEIAYDNHRLPATGIRAFIDIQGDDVFFVWEGSLRIIKINLRSKEKTTFGVETSYYTKPDGFELAENHKKGDKKGTWEKQKKMSYIRNIFATSRHVFLVYETGKNEKSKNGSTYRLQTYTPDGDFLGDVAIPGSPLRQMWLTKESYELYAFSKESGGLSVLKYKIKINR